MSVCKKVSEEMPALISGECHGPQKVIVQQHLDSCPDCQQEWETTLQVWRQLDQFEMIKVPASLQRKTLSMIYREAELELQQASSLLRRMGALTFWKMIMAVAGGIMLAFIFIFLLHQKIALQPLSTNQLVSLGVVWSGLLIAGFSWILGKFRIHKFQLSAPTYLAILATMLVMIGTYYCPEATAYQWWETSILGTAAKSTLGAVLSCCLFGILYVLPAATLISVVLHKKFQGPILGNALISAIIFTALLLPAIYVQCANLASGMLLSWASGSLVGALSGIYGGLKLAHEF